MINFDDIKPILRIAARQHFWAFCCYFDYEFFHVRRPFLKDVALAFQSVVDNYKEGKAIKISVSMPPRSGKSYITSLFSAYWLCTFPELSVMRNTCTSTLYDKFSYDTRAIFRSMKLAEVFPEIEIQQDKQNVGGWNLKTAKQVSYFGSGVGGTIIGFGANIAITDDLYKSMQDALSSTVQNSVKSWKQSAHDSRKEKNCPEIFIGTRWTKNDIIGEAIDSGDLSEIITIQALIDEKSFCEDVKSTEEYLKIRETTDKIIWEAEYMQNPIEVEGLLLPHSSLRFDDMSKINRADCEYCFAVGDPADRGGDKYSMPFMFVSTNGGFTVYVVDVVHNTFGIMENTPDIVNRCRVHGVDDLFIESNGVGLAAVLQLKQAITGATNMRAFPSTDEKEVRILSGYEFIQRYFVFDSAYKDKPQYREFMSDLTGYVRGGDNKHKKDAIDVLSTAANILKIKFRREIY